MKTRPSPKTGEAGMTQGSERHGFALKAIAKFGVVFASLRHKLQRYVTAEPQHAKARKQLTSLQDHEAPPNAGPMHWMFGH